MKNEIKEILDTPIFIIDDEGFTVYINDKINDYITSLQEKLEVSQTNEETYRLEMQDITKCLGLDEHTIFDEVKEKATNLQEEIERLNNIIKRIKDHFIFLKINSNGGNKEFFEDIIEMIETMEELKEGK